MRSSRATVVVMSCVLLYSAGARAQEAVDPVNAPQERLVWRPSLALTNLGYDSNVFNRDVLPQGDFFAAIEGRLRPIWQVSDATLTADTGLTYNYFHEFVSERGIDATARGRLEFPISLVRLHVSGSYQNLRQRVNFEIDQRARRTDADVTTGFDLSLGGHMKVGLQLRRLRVNFDDDGLGNASLRYTLNRTERGGGANLQYAITPLTTFVATGDVSEQEFEYSTNRNGERTKLGAGLTFSSGALVTGQSFIGWQRLTVPDSLVSSFSGLVGLVDLTVPVGSGTRFGGRLGRDVQFSADEVLTYYVENRFGGSVIQAFGERWEAGVRAERIILDYASPSGEAEVTGYREHLDLLGSSLAYRFAGGLRIGVDVEIWRRRDENIARRSYNTRRVFTSISRPLGF